MLINYEIKQKNKNCIYENVGMIHFFVCFFGWCFLGGGGGMVIII